MSLVAQHGVGMADEWPAAPLHTDYDKSVMAGEIQAGMVICVESLIGGQDRECVKLAMQVLLTDEVPERLDQFTSEGLQRNLSRRHQILADPIDLQKTLK